MSLVRFVFYAHNHSKPSTGYIAIRVIDGEKWTMSSRSLTKRELTTLEGVGMHKGGEVFLEELHHFIAYWATAQADAIEKHRLWSSAKRPQEKLVRPGFRAITAEKQWRDYVRDTEAEITLIKKDFCTAQEELFTNGWLPTPDLTPFPILTFGEPWASH
jgi:hypothetical protein